ncbi:MAG: SoxR reducing system RseC family protein [Deltaproteobacteria bacterium]|nr:SoxR reducing system RseC family protein [Deltaproteobacteria bacterium]
MPENIGIVIKTEPNEYAQVLLDRKNACGGCESSGTECHSCLAGAKKIQSRAVNRVGAKVGDVVKLQLSFGILSAGAAILYLLPIVAMLCGAFAGHWLAEWSNMAEVTASILGAVCGLVFGFVIVIFIDRSPGMRNKITPTITEIVTPDIRMTGVNKASCCSY